MRLISAIISVLRPAMPVAGAAAGGGPDGGGASEAAGGAEGGALGAADGGALGGALAGSIGGALGNADGGPVGGALGGAVVGAAGGAAAAGGPGSPRRIDSATSPESAVTIAAVSPSRKSKRLSDEGPAVVVSAASNGVLAAAIGVTSADLRSLRIFLRLAWNSVTCLATVLSASAKSFTDFERNSETRIKMASLSVPDILATPRHP